MLKSILKIGGIITLAAALLISGGLLFFEKEIIEIWRGGGSSGNGNGGQFHAADRGELTIAYATPLTTLEPTSFSGTDRARLANIYEPLIRPDKNFNIEPVLAVSYGMLEKDLWEFTLRSNVKFHDGTLLDAGDVVKSIERAQNHKDSQLRDMLDTIKEVEDRAGKIYIRTKNPDPLFLNKLSTVLIFPSEARDIEKNSIGTGPYKWTANGAEFEMDLNPDYRGPLPAFSKVIIKTIPEKEKRLKALRDNEIDVLANVPPDSAEELKGAFQIETIPSLEASYIIFNLKKGANIVRDSRFREAVKLAIDPQKLIKMTYGFARPLNQFVSNGVFGFSTNISTQKRDLSRVNDLIRKASPADKPVFTLDISKGLENFGQALKEMLAEGGIELELNFLDWDTLSKKIEQGESDAYFLGWRSELGDSFDFLNSVAYSKGNFNNKMYKNKKVDTLIEESAHEMDPKKRLAKLKTAMEIITEKDIIGVPLIESETLYAIASGIKWDARLDGMILAKDIK